MVDQIKELQGKMVRCLREDGFIEDFCTWEIVTNLISAKKNKIKLMNTSKEGLVLSHLDNVTDFTIPFSDERAKREVMLDNIEGFMRREWWPKPTGKKVFSRR
jgi:hypothetical protein